MNAIELEQAIDKIEAGFAALGSLMEEPASLNFSSLHPHMERLEQALAPKTFITLAFVYVVQRDDGGRVVNSSNPVDYLTRRLGMKYGEALNLIETARRVFEPVPEPEAAPAGDEASASEEAEDQAAAAQAAEARAAAARAEKEREERAREEKRAQEEARRKLRERDAAHQRVIEMLNRELEHLNKHAKPGRLQIFNAALEEAKKRNFTDLRTWVVDQIRRANAAGRTPEGKPDPFAATRKRKLWFGQADADGGVHFGGYLDGPTAALLAKALAPAARPGGPNLPPEEDTRSAQQRRADQLAAILLSYLNGKEASREGAGAIVISATMSDLENLSPTSLLPTDTGHLLTPLDLVRLGGAAHDYLCILDDSSFMPLALGRSKRTATFAQKLALIATELCCSHPGCTKAASECDVHHDIAWFYNGPTDIQNFTLQCRRHHVNNNDARDGRNNMGNTERDPSTGRMGFRRPGNPHLEFNESALARHSAAAKLRQGAHQHSQDPPGPSEAA